jgi:hypothetical protein
VPTLAFTIVSAPQRSSAECFDLWFRVAFTLKRKGQILRSLAFRH